MQYRKGILQVPAAARWMATLLRQPPPEPAAWEPLLTRLSSLRAQYRLAGENHPLLKPPALMNPSIRHPRLLRASSPVRQRQRPSSRGLLTCHHGTACSTPWQIERGSEATALLGPHRRAGVSRIWEGSTASAAQLGHRGSTAPHAQRAKAFPAPFPPHAHHAVRRPATSSGVERTRSPSPLRRTPRGIAPRSASPSYKPAASIRGPGCQWYLAGQRWAQVYISADEIQASGERACV